MTTLFTNIINGDIPSHKIAEDEFFYSFLDIRPISVGHTLVIPKQEVDHFYDMDDVYLSKILVFAQPIVKAIESVVSCLRVGSMIAGLEVPHAHLHLVPITDMRTFSFEYARLADPDTLKPLAEKIRAVL